jgi:hypothetical protein
MAWHGRVFIRLSGLVWSDQGWEKKIGKTPYSGMNWGNIIKVSYLAWMCIMWDLGLGCFLL